MEDLRSLDPMSRTAVVEAALAACEVLFVSPRMGSAEAPDETMVAVRRLKQRAEAGRFWEVVPLDPVADADDAHHLVPWVDYFEGWTVEGDSVAEATVTGEDAGRILLWIPRPGQVAPSQAATVRFSPANESRELKRASRWARGRSRLLQSARDLGFLQIK